MEAFCGSTPEQVGSASSVLACLGGLEDILLLYYRWIAEPNPEIRRTILMRMKKLHPEGYLIGGMGRNGLEGWVSASRRFKSPEREERLAELVEFFPQTASLIGERGPDDN